MDKRRARVVAAAVVFLAAALAGCSGARPPSFSSPHERSHPLVGVILDVSSGRTLSPTALARRLAAADVSVLGEKHDNPDHHATQAWLVRRIVAAGRRPAVAFEMLDVETQPDVDRYLEVARPSAAGFAEAVDWERGGWPPFEDYRPIVDAALAAGLPIVAADIRADGLRRLGRDAGGAEATVRVRLGLQTPLDAVLLASMSEEIRVSHCGYVPEGHVSAMAEMQRARDAHLADRVLRRGSLRGAVLIAGAGHARNDRGVPAHLRRRAPGLSVASLALLEVVPGLERPADYGVDAESDSLPFDYVWWTPRITNEDPCEKFRRQLEAMRNAHAGTARRPGSEAASSVDSER